MELQTYEVGEPVPLRAEFTDADGDPADPTTITVSVRDPDGDVTTKVHGVDVELVRESAGIYTYAHLVDLAGIWRYRWVGTGAVAAVDEGQFIVRSQFAPENLSPRALCTLDDVLLYMDPDEALGDESQIVRLIGSASREFHRVARREFVAINATRDPEGNRVVEPATRSFDVGWGGSRRVIRIGDLAELDDVTIDGTAVAPADMLAVPRVRQEWQPIRRLRLEPTLASTSVIAVTGTWGFPEIPEDVTQHVIETVLFWAKRDLTTFGEVFVSEMGLVRRGDDSLPGPAYKCALSYRRRRGVRSIRVGG